MITIDDEIERLGPLKNAAAAIVDYAKEGARQSKSEFRCYSSEWTLEPDNWIHLKLTHLRKQRIHISLGVCPVFLDKVQGLEIKPGRWPSLSKISIESPLQIPAALRCLEKAYYTSNNSYRRRHGKPKPAEPC
jgi:hypothetical protein